MRHYVCLRYKKGKIMKILQINSVCGVGSTGKICVDIAKVAKEYGHECVIAYGRGEAKGWDAVYKITNSIGNKLHFVKSRIFDRHGLGNSFETKKFVKFIKTYDPDVIHLHNIHGYYINYKILFDYIKTSRAKIVWTMHDMWPITGHCAQSLDCKKWEHQCQKCNYLNDYPKSILDNSFKNYNDKKGENVYEGKNKNERDNNVMLYSSTINVSILHIAC